MPWNLLYLILILGSVLSVIAFSFNPKHPYHKYWSGVLLSSFYVAVPFIIWDVIFTKKGIWGFNSDYLTGLKLINLPIEEVAFFFAIPFASVFIYFSVIYFFKPSKNKAFFNNFTLILALVLLAVGLVHLGRYYTFITFTGIGFVLLYFWYKKVNLSLYYLSYLIVLIPFFIVNGILTGMITPKPVVWYNDNHNLGIRLGTVPFDDIFYGMLLIFPIIYLVERKFGWSGKK